MAKVEQLSRLSVNLSPHNSYELTMLGLGGKHRLAIVEPTEFGRGSSSSSQDLLRTVMLAHLVSPHFPKVIETNFAVESGVFLDHLYNYYGYSPPTIRRSGDQIIPSYQNSNYRQTPTLEAASAHSGGLDSAYRLTKLISEGTGVLAVHLRNLNLSGNSREAVASREQCSQWHVPYESVRLVNSSGNYNSDTMRTRDMFLSLVTAISASSHRSSRIYIEGGMFDDPDRGHFSENTAAWAMFNRLIKDSDLNMEVVGIDPGDVETINEVVKFEQKLKIDILPSIQNCFSAPFQLPNNRQKWQRLTPKLAEISPLHWCGSCHKCRRMTLGRIIYDPRFAELSASEVSFFARDTYDWMRKYPHNRDLLSDSFKQHLATLHL